MLISPQIPTLNIKEVNIAMMSVDTYCVTCKLQRAQIFAISMKDLEYQVRKEARLETNLKTIVSVEYHNFLDIFSKKNLHTFPLHQKYNYKIIL